MALTLVLPGVVSCVAAWLVTPAVCELALRLRIIDAPDGFRKLHRRTVPLGGGIAVALGVVLTTSMAYVINVPWASHLFAEPAVFIGAAVGAMLVCILGLVDDRYRLRGRQKLIGQIVAAIPVVLGGTVIQQVSVFGTEFELGLASIPFTVLWLVGAVNALNLIDGVDGLATTVGMILSLTLATLAAMTGHWGEAAVAAMLAGSLLGFLRYNWPPARIFLGDAGSMFIGFCLAILAIRSSLKGPATVAMVAPTAIWAIPLFDVGMAILRRKLTGQSIYTADREHLHHVLQRRGFGSAGTVLVIAGLCAVCGVGALASVFWQNELMAAIVSGSVLILLVATRCFGHSECHLFLRRTWEFVSSFVRPRIAGAADEIVSAKFHGSPELEDAWQSLVDFAERFNLSTLRLNVNAPMLGEVFHAQWRRREQDSDDGEWKTDVPLFWGVHQIGRLRVSGTVPDGISPFAWSCELMEALEPFENQLQDVLGDLSESSRPASATIPVV